MLFSSCQQWNMKEMLPKQSFRTHLWWTWRRSWRSNHSGLAGVEEGVQLGFVRRKMRWRKRKEEVVVYCLWSLSYGHGKGVGEEGHPDCHYETQGWAPGELHGQHTHTNKWSRIHTEGQMNCSDLNESGQVCVCLMYQLPGSPHHDKTCKGTKFVHTG